MRRWPVVLMAAGLLPLGGCRAVREMFTARPEFAAEAKGQQLKVERLAAIMSSIKGVPMTPEAAKFIANMWVDYTLLSQALAAGRDLTDSATVKEAVWPDLAEALGSAWHDSLVSHRTPLSPAVADSIYQADSVRVFQQILIRIQKNATPAVRAAARKKIDQLYAKVKSGGDFGKLATQMSEDPGSKTSGGYLPPSPRGKYVTAFDSAGWALAPGAMTGIVESPFGLHIIRRPAAAEVRDKLLEFARQRTGQKLDSVYLDSLGFRKHLKIADNAPARMRDALADMDGKIHSTEALGTYDGGTLTVHDFLHWVTALGPKWATDLPTRPDSSLTQFVWLIARNKLLLAQADSAGVTVSAEDWQGLRGHYLGQLDSLRQSLGMAGSDISDPATTPVERARVAAVKLEAFWDAMGAGHAHPRPIPGQLSAVLRAEGGYRVNEAAIDRTLELARDLKAKADSAAQAANGARHRPPMPGAPPTMPGAAPTTPEGK